MAEAREVIRVAQEPPKEGQPRLTTYPFFVGERGGRINVLGLSEPLATVEIPYPQLQLLKGIYPTGPKDPDKPFVLLGGIKSIPDAGSARRAVVLGAWGTKDKVPRNIDLHHVKIFQNMVLRHSGFNADAEVERVTGGFARPVFHTRLGERREEISIDEYPGWLKKVWQAHKTKLTSKDEEIAAKQEGKEEIRITGRSELNLLLAPLQVVGISGEGGREAIFLADGETFRGWISPLEADGLQRKMEELREGDRLMAFAIKLPRQRMRQDAEALVQSKAESFQPPPFVIVGVSINVETLQREHIRDWIEKTLSLPQGTKIKGLRPTNDGKIWWIRIKRPGERLSSKLTPRNLSRWFYKLEPKGSVIGKRRGYEGKKHTITEEGERHNVLTRMDIADLTGKPDL